MAEQVQTSEIANAQLANKGIVSSFGNSLEKLRKFSNEPLSRGHTSNDNFVCNFIGMILFISSRNLLEQHYFHHYRA